MLWRENKYVDATSGGKCTKWTKWSLNQTELKTAQMIQPAVLFDGLLWFFTPFSCPGSPLPCQCGSSKDLVSQYLLNLSYRCFSDKPLCEHWRHWICVTFIVFQIYNPFYTSDSIHFALRCVLGDYVSMAWNILFHKYIENCFLAIIVMARLDILESAVRDISTWREKDWLTVESEVISANLKCWGNVCSLVTYIKQIFWRNFRQKMDKIKARQKSTQ